MRKFAFIPLFALFLGFSCLGFSACDNREMLTVDGYGIFVHKNGEDCTIVQLPMETLAQSVWEIPETLGKYTVVQVGDTTTRGFMFSPEEIIGSFGYIRKMIVPACVKNIRGDNLDDVLVFQTELSPSTLKLGDGYDTYNPWWQSPQEENNGETTYRYLTEENFDGDLIYIIEGETEQTATLLGALASGTLTVPQTFRGVPITKLADRAFYKGKYTSVTVEENIVELGTEVFALSDMTEIVLPSNCEEIPEKTFYDSVVKSVDIPSSVTRIGNNAFEYSALVEMNLPSSVTTIGEYAFASSNLTEITLPSSVVEVGRDAFAGTPLTFADLSQTQLTMVAPKMFSHCPLTDGVLLPDTVTSIQSCAFEYTDLTSFTFPTQLKKIYGEAFKNVQLSDIHLPDGLEEIEIGAFENNLALTELSLPDSCLDFDGIVIRGCTNLKTLHLGNVESFSYIPTELNLTKIAVSDSNQVLYVKEGILYRKNVNGTHSLIKCPQGTPCERIVLENCLLSSAAFYKHPTLKEITIIFSGSNYDIPPSAFYGCTALEKVVLPDVEGIIIKTNAFYQCVNLSEINTDKVTNFYAYSFEGCSSLQEVNLSSATIIDGRVFKDCDLREVHTYHVDRIGVNAFENNVNLERVTLENCQNISFDAFKGCKRLKYCSYGDATVDTNAFAGTPLSWKIGCKSFPWL